MLLSVFYPFPFFSLQEHFIFLTDKRGLKGSSAKNAKGMDSTMLLLSVSTSEYLKVLFISVISSHMFPRFLN